jgi:hypothetical protein
VICCAFAATDIATRRKRSNRGLIISCFNGNA